MNGSFANLACSASQPATAPGTVTLKTPLCGISVTPAAAASAVGVRAAPFARRNSGVRPEGAQPLAFSPYSFPVFAS